MTGTAPAEARPVMRPRAADLAFTLLVAFVVLGPILTSRGYSLRGDMVFVPEQPWKDAWLGLDGATPRFVPGDALLSLATQVVPGDVVQKGILLGALLLGGVGAARMVHGHPLVGRWAAVLLFLWNPWVEDRLSIGQWGIVVGYACLPWVVGAAVRLRDDTRGGWAPLTAWLGVCAVLSPASALVATGTALGVVLARPRWSTALVTVGASLVLNLPWIVPSLLLPSGITAPEGQFAGFAARGESALGVVPSVLSFGGIWKASVVPEERTVALVVALSLVPTVLGVLGWRRARREDPATMAGLTAVAVVAVLVTLLPAVGPVEHGLEAADDFVSALGLLRDSQRFLGPAVLVLLPGVAVTVSAIAARARRGREAVVVLAWVAAAWPVLCLPSLAWGLQGDLAPVRYPQEWEGVADVMSDGRTVVLPWTGSYRGFAWNRLQATLDPAPRYFAGDVVIDDRHYLEGRVLASENPLLRDVELALSSGRPEEELRALGVRQVLLEKGNGTSVDEMPEGRVVHDGPELRLVDLGAGAAAERDAPPRGPVLAADVLAALCFLCAVVGSVAKLLYGSRNSWAQIREGF